MPKQIKRIWKQVAAREHIFGAITIFVMILVASLATMLIVINPSPVKAAPTDFTYCKQITINRLLVNQTLAGFPVWVYKSSDTDFATNILTNGSDIAFYDSTNATQFPHEIEVWNKTTGELGVWVNVSSVSSATDTVIYMYYGFPSKGSNKNYNPTLVWDNNYVMIQHMNDSTTSTTTDSTSNGNNGVKVATNLPVEGTGKLGMGQNFTNYTNGFINVTDSASLSALSTITLEAWVKNARWVIYGSGVIQKGDSDPNFEFCMKQDVLNLLFFELVSAAGGNYLEAYINTSNVSDGTWHQIVQTYDGTNAVGHQKIYVDGALVALVSNTKGGTGYAPHDGSSQVEIGRGDQSNTKIFNGTIDEVRISNINRNDSWVNASFNNQISPSTFLTFGSQTGGAGASSFSLKYDVGTNINWAGTAGTSVWSNETGSSLETLEINMTINSTDNVTDIRVWVGDMNDTGLWVNASNISLYISSDNTSYGLLGTFTDGGSNLTINSTLWNAGTMGASPFYFTGITNTNRSIYCRFRLAIPSTTTTNYYFNNTACYVYPGRYV